MEQLMWIFLILSLSRKSLLILLLLFFTSLIAQLYYLSSFYVYIRQILYMYSNKVDNT
jgi:hypothetical protein